MQRVGREDEVVGEPGGRPLGPGLSSGEIAKAVAKLEFLQRTRVRACIRGGLLSLLPPPPVLLLLHET